MTDDDRITYPDTLMPGRLAAGADYASVQQILMAEDLPQATLHIPHWRAWIRVRAPSLSDMEQIGQAAAGADQYITTIRLCCVAPTFTPEQAEALRDKNPQAIEQIARFVWLLSSLKYDWIERVVQTETGADAAPTPAPTARARAARVRPPGRRVAAAAGD